MVRRRLELGFTLAFGLALTPLLTLPLAADTAAQEVDLHPGLARGVDDVIHGAAAARHDSGGGEELGALAPAPPTGSAMFLPDTYTFAEESLNNVTVVRTGDTSGSLTVQLRTVDGTATVSGGAFADYFPKLETLTWAAGDTSSRQPFLEIGGDDEVEGTEHFTLELYQPFVEAGQLVDTATVTILDDDFVATIAVPALDGVGLFVLAGLLGAAALAFLRRG